MQAVFVALMLLQMPPKRGGQPGVKPQRQSAEAAAKQAEPENKFRALLRGAKTLSVQMLIKQDRNPIPGHATLVIEKPDNLYFHLSWGKDDYTYTVLHGQATEVDKGQRAYDEYAVLELMPPEANASDWMVSFFPVAFVTEQVILYPDNFDESGKLAQYSIKSGVDEGLRNNQISFSDYKINEPVPESLFKQTVPTGFTAVSTPRPAPPIQIGSSLPNVKLANAGGQLSSLLSTTGGRPTLFAYLDPNSPPSVASLKFLQTVKGVRVVILNANSHGRGLHTGSLPCYHDPKGNLEQLLQAPMTPLFYLANGSGKVVNVWYGFDRDAPGKFEKQIKDATVELHSSSK